MSIWRPLKVPTEDVIACPLFTTIKSMLFRLQYFTFGCVRFEMHMPSQRHSQFSKRPTLLRAAPQSGYPVVHKYCIFPRPRPIGSRTVQRSWFLWKELDLALLPPFVQIDGAAWWEHCQSILAQEYWPRVNARVQDCMQEVEGAISYWRV